MEVREFSLLNEKGQSYSLMDIKEHALLTSPSGLGYSYSDEYQRLGYSFISNLRAIEQGSITGTLNFLEYDNYKNFVNFIEQSEKLRFSYTIPYVEGEKTFYRDIQLTSSDKTEKQPNGIISEGVTFACLSLWYSSTIAYYTMQGGDNEMRWNFTWDPRFSNYSVRSLTYINDGHVDAPIELEIDSNVQNPKLQLYVEGQLWQEIPFTITIGNYEKLLYGTKEDNFYLLKEEADGTKVNIFNLNVVDLEKDNVLRIPKGKSCELRILADNDISKATITIYTYYKAI